MPINLPSDSQASSRQAISVLAVAALVGCTAVAAAEHFDNVLSAAGSDADSVLHGEHETNATGAEFDPIAGYRQISGGQFHTCGVKVDNTLWCWGRNDDGQLGVGNTNSQDTPQRVTGLSGVKQVAAGGNHTLVLLDDGTVRGFGKNDYGQLGDGSTDNRIGPVVVTGASGVSQISAGHAHSMFLKADGTVQGVGLNAQGQLGSVQNSGTSNPNASLLTVSGLFDVASLSAGSHHTLALMPDGTVKSFGYNRYGQLGHTANNDTGSANPGPTVIGGLNDVTQISAGIGHSMFLKSDGTVQGVGLNYSGQLGATQNSGTTNPNPSPIAASGLSGITDIAAGGGHTLVLAQDGTAKSFGRNIEGQLGLGMADTSAHPTPTTIPSLSNVRAVWTGSNAYSSFFGFNSGQVWAAGRNTNGQLGDGTTTNRFTPVRVSGS